MERQRKSGSMGTSGLGVEYNATTVNIASGGIISGGFGGGGGGGGAHDHDHKSERTASGSGGGGGAGVPVGQGGMVVTNNGTGGADGSGENAINGELAGGGGETNNEMKQLVVAVVMVDHRMKHQMQVKMDLVEKDQEVEVEQVEMVLQ